MHRLFIFLGFLLLPLSSSYAGIDETINAATAPIAEVIKQIVFFNIPIFGAELPMVVLWLVASAVFFTFYLGFINVRGFKHAIHLARGVYSHPESRGEVSHFQALATAISGTVSVILVVLP